jgi:hypothetical protein
VWSRRRGRQITSLVSCRSALSLGPNLPNTVSTFWRSTVSRERSASPAAAKGPMSDSMGSSRN